jgi:UDP-3-O-[3-hydroxymyristoyl] glucosamine N-acyltransferase
MATGDPRFFARSGPFTLGRIAEAISATVDPAVAAGEFTREFTGVAPLQDAGPGQVSFLSNRRYAGTLPETRAGAVILQAEFASRLPGGTVPLVVAEPYLAWARLGALFHPEAKVTPGVHSSAVIDPAAMLDPAAEIGPYAVIGAGAEIGPGARIGPHVVVGPGVVVGPDCRIGAHVTLSHAIIGARVTLHPGVRIGQDGFGFARGPEGFVSVTQLGRVILEDDVDIGANTTVDRGSAQDTIIGRGTRIDNQVQIAHNVRLGRFCVIVAQVGISGSTTFEDQVVVAGQAGFSGHLTVGKGANIGPQAGVMSDVAAGARLLGSPAQPVNAFFREVAMLRRLARETAKSTEAKSVQARAARGSQGPDDAAKP